MIIRQNFAPVFFNLNSLEVMDISGGGGGETLSAGILQSEEETMYLV